MNRYGSIYIVTNTVTGEQYVGQTRQKALRRWKCHIKNAVKQKGRVRGMYTLKKVA